MADRNLDGWKAAPLRRGDIYCSPGCGFNCTHKAYLRALSAADAIVEHMGPMWEPYVWENCGWNFMAKHKVSHIHIMAQVEGSKISGDWELQHYYANARFGGQQFHTYKEAYADPEEAVRKVIEDATAARDRYIKELADFHASDPS